MPRAGSQKVKTGCKTCKARKVKCDETWPKCKRCTTTGRTCDGYRAPPAGSFSWDVLLRAAQPRLIPVTNPHEVRSLSYFHHAVAPILSGPFDSSFWTYFVAQMTHSEPAARHAVLAISSLYESFEPSCSNQPRVDRFAIVHYNQAISLLVHDPKPSIDNVLLVCVLFICIEFLRGNREAAISHASHGVRLLNAAGHNSRLSTTFSQMSIFPLFFIKEGIDFPLLSRNGSTDEKSPVFFSMSEAQHALDHLCIRTLRLIRAGTPYRFDAAQETPPPEMYEARRQALKDLEAWDEAFEKFQATRSAADREDTAPLALQTRQRLTKIWCSECLEKGEMGYDALKSDFIKIVGYARKAAENLKARRITPAKFMFDTGFNPMLHFIVKKCRFLRLRLEALHLLRTLASERESLWDASLMYDVSRRIIEVEHDIDISGDFDRDDETMPPDEKRVRGFYFKEGEETPLWDTSAEIIYFVVANPEGGVAVRKEFLKRDGDFHCQQRIHRHSLW